MKISFSKLTLSFLIVGWSALSLCSCASEETTRVPAKMSLENADEMGLSAITFSNRSETKTSFLHGGRGLVHPYP